MRLRQIPMLVAIATLSSGQSFADVVQAGRYTLVVTTPYADQVDPLAAVVSVSFPRQSVRTVGDAAMSVLSRSGYTLAQDSWTLPLSFPLPDVQRRFDNVDVRGILQALGGPGYALRVDPAARSIAYELRSEPAATPPRVEASATDEDTPEDAEQTGEPTSLLPADDAPASDEEGVQ